MPTTLEPSYSLKDHDLVFHETSLRAPSADYVLRVRDMPDEDRPRERLAQAGSIPLTKACQLVAAFELGRRFHANQYGRPVQVRNARKAYDYVKNMGQSQKEQLRGLYLNSRYQVINDEVISVGSLTSNVVHPSEVFQPAIERGAVALILAHNHPSGRLEPTKPDIQITEQLVVAGDLLGIELLDHIIVTATKYTSVMECLRREP